MRTTVETAAEEDGAKLLAVMESGHSDGMFRMIATRRPNPVVSYARENPGARIGIIRDKNRQIAAQFCVSPGEFYINGSIHRVGYVGGVRKNPKYPGILDWKAMADYVAAVGCDLYTCSFLGDNEDARKIFSRKRKHFPQLFPLTEYTTYMINPRAVSYRAAAEYSFRVMAEADRERVITFINQEGARYQFAPVVRSFSQFYGLNEGDCYLLERDGEIKAFGALWNQSSYKQYIVTEYRGYMKWMEKFSWLSEKAGYIPMPEKNTALNFPSLSFFYAKGGDKGLYETFLAYICRIIRENYKLFLIGMAHSHPNHSSIQSIRSIHFDSHLYYVRYDHDFVPDEGVPVYYECALL